MIGDVILLFCLKRLVVFVLHFDVCSGCSHYVTYPNVGGARGRTHVTVITICHICVKQVTEQTARDTPSYVIKFLTQTRPLIPELL